MVLVFGVDVFGCVVVLVLGAGCEVLGCLTAGPDITCAALEGRLLDRGRICNTTHMKTGDRNSQLFWLETGFERSD